MDLANFVAAPGARPTAVGRFEQARQSVVAVSLVWGAAAHAVRRDPELRRF